jgi:hypothetical protein
LDNNFLVDLDIKNSETIKPSRRHREINVRVRCTTISYWREGSHCRNRREVKKVFSGQFRVA